MAKQNPGSNSSAQNSASPAATPAGASPAIAKAAAALAGGIGAMRTYDLRRDKSRVPDTNRLQMTITSDIIDRFEGMARTIEIWGSSPNAEFVSEKFKDLDLRKAVAEFFLQRRLVRVIADAIPVKIMRGSDVTLTKIEWHNAILKEAATPAAAMLISELTIPVMSAIGLLDGSTMKYSRHLTYGFKRVVVADIRHDVTVAQVLKSVQVASKVVLDPQKRYSVPVIADKIASAMYQVGQAIHEIIELSSVVDDLVKGVRAHLDPTGLAGARTTGAMTADWRRHPVVEALAGNLVFITAALSLPKDTSLVTQNGYGTLDRWSAVVLDAIKTSPRYGWVGKEEYLRTFGTVRIRDARGRVKAAVLTRSAKVEPVAQAVIALEDASAREIWNISATNDQIVSAIHSAYGQATFSTVDAAETLVFTLEHTIQAGWTGHKALYVADDGSADLTVLALMMADRVHVEVREGDFVVEKTLKPTDQTYIYAPRWWYTVGTTEKDLDVWSGVHTGDEVRTCDPIEVFLAKDDVQVLDGITARTQVLGPEAFGTQVIELDPDTLRTAEARFSFHVDVHGVTMSGNFNATDFATLRVENYTQLVRPHFNAEVIEGYQRILERVVAIVQEVASAPDEKWQDKRPSDISGFLLRQLCHRVLMLARGVSPEFRSNVHEAMVDRTIAKAGLSVGDSVLMRTRLFQQSFAAIADLQALRFFLFIQGINDEGLRLVYELEQMQAVCQETGSDRR